jgi:hypothetical protein
VTHAYLLPARTAAVLALLLALIGSDAPLFSQDDVLAESRILLPEQVSPGPTAVAEPEGAATRAVEAAERVALPTTELGVAVLDRATGELAVGGRRDEPFYIASLAKLVVVVDVLDRRRLEGLAVSDADVKLMRRALGPSDDNAMNALWPMFNGAGAAERLSARLGLAATTMPADAFQWGQMSAPASDVVRLYDYVLGQMPAAERDLIVEALAATPAIASDGFDQTYGLLSPELDGPGIAKQAWMCCFSGRYYLHTTGTVGAQQRYVVALLNRIPAGRGWDAARAEVTAAAGAAVRALS